MTRYILIVIAVGLFSSCVSKKKFQELELAREGVMTEGLELQKALNVCEDDNSSLLNQIVELNGQLKRSELDFQNEQGRRQVMEEELAYQKKTSTNLLDRLSDLSVINKTGAESIKKSLEAINDQSAYIKDLTSELKLKDSVNLALVINLKRSLADINDEDVSIEVKKGVVYISISDRMLFNSGSSNISGKAEIVLGKIAKVLNDQPQLEILVEGHTDNVPISRAGMLDNWDLSVKRATTVVRTLQSKYGVAPQRMTAGGRSEFVPKAGNDTSVGRSINRRTEIIVLPQLDQFFELMEVKIPEGK